MVRKFLDDPTPADIERQLGRILENRRFRNAPKMSSLLQYLVQKTLQEGGDQINAAGIARHVFGKNDGFKSYEDPLVRVATCRLRDAIALYNATEGMQADIVIEFEPSSYVAKASYRTLDRRQETTVAALATAANYQATLTQSKSQLAFDALNCALKREPEDVVLLSAFADACLDTYKYGWECRSGQTLDDGWQAVETAVSIDGNEPHVAFQSAMFELQSGNLGRVAQLGQEICEQHGEDTEFAMLGTWMVALTLEPSEAAETLDLDPPEDCQMPGWMHHPAFLARYHCGDYESALGSAIAFGMPDFFWGPLERAAAMGQLGLSVAARKEVDNLIKLNPGFSEDPRWHLRHHIAHDEVIEHVLEGLHKAGLAL